MLSRLKKARINQLKLKPILIVFFEINSILMVEWVPQCHTVNLYCYLEVLAKVKEQMKKGRIVENITWALH